jgi:hypothetical protein
MQGVWVFMCWQLCALALQLGHNLTCSENVKWGSQDAPINVASGAKEREEGLLANSCGRTLSAVQYHMLSNTTCGKHDSPHPAVTAHHSGSEHMRWGCHRPFCATSA